MNAECNLRANMHIFRLADQNPDQSSAVVLHEEGDLGLYNRANRSIYHTVETGISLIVTLPLCFYTYTLPTGIIATIYCLGRMIY